MSKHNKQKKIVVTKKVPDTEAFKLISEKVDRFGDSMRSKMEELIAKHNALAGEIEGIKKLQQQFMMFTAQEMGKATAQQQAIASELGSTIDHLDVNVLSLAEVMKEVFGQLQQIDHIFQNAKVVSAEGGYALDVDVIKDADVPGIKEGAQKWFDTVVASAFKTIQDRRAEEQRVAEENARKAKEEAERAAKDKSEKELVEKELARESGVQQIGAGGLGADIPEGADVFGGP